MDKVQQLLLQDKNTKIKCDKCEFEAKNLNGLNMHKKAKHPDNSNQLAFVLFFIVFQRAPSDVKVQL